MTIHSSHPFADAVRDPGRAFRGRLGGRVSLWTSGIGAGRAGLTVTSLLAVGGEPWRLVAALDPDADFTDALLASGRAVVSLLTPAHRQLAEAFAGGPAPGGPFKIGEWVDTEWGPRPADVTTWSGVRITDQRAEGWSLLVTCELDRIELGADDAALLHYRGEYRAEA